MVAWSLKCNIWSHIFKKNFNGSETRISHVQHILFISSECPFHTLGVWVYDISSIHHYFIFFFTTKSIGQPKV